jgi:magnesium transporter
MSSSKAKTYFRKSYHPPGTSPGTLRDLAGIDTGLKIHLIDYTLDEFTEQPAASAEDCKAILERQSTTWIHVQGQVDNATLQSLGDMFELHPLALEDVQNVGQRSKIEDYEGQTFVILNLPHLQGDTITATQISLFFAEGYVISFHNGEDDPFEPIRKRLRGPVGRFRNRGSDYLLYALVDLIVDQGFPLLEQLGETLEELESQILDHPSKAALNNLHGVRRELLLLRRMLLPHREIMGQLMSHEQIPVREDTRLYLRDCYDHCIHIMETITTYRDMTRGMLDVYLSSISNRTNETMRVLTIIATIFIPLTFIVGVYGMNFSNEASPWAMPELYWYYGYPMVWGLMILVTGGLLFFFRKNKWI